MTAKNGARPFRLGFVGLDALGLAMVRRLVARGWKVTCCDADAARKDALLKLGAAWADTPGAARAASDIVILCLAGDDAVEQACLGDGGLASARGAHIVIDFSTTGVELTRSLGEGMDVAWLDCPVSGPPEAAERGQLSMTAGGTSDLFDWVRPILDDLGAVVTLIGPLGAGQTAKLISQAIVGTTYVLIAEVLAQVRASSIDGEKLVQALRGGLADSVMLQRVLPQMTAGQFEPPKSRAGQLSADLAELRAFNTAAGLDLPVQEMAIAQYRRFADNGNADKDSAAIALLYQADDDAT